MRKKKTWFSYVLWLPCTALTGISLAACITSATAAFGVEKFAVAGMICLYFALLAGLFAGGRKAVASLADRAPEDLHFYRMFECFAALCVFAGAVLVRLRYLRLLSVLPEAGPYFAMAQVNGAGRIPQTVHGASYVYTAALSTLFTFFGNKLAAGVFFQFFLQLLLLPVLYFGVRLLSGPLPALAAAAAAAFLPAFIRGMCRLTPESLYLLLYATGLLFLGLCLSGADRREYRNSGALFCFLLTGLYAGALTWMDLSGGTLLFFGHMAPLSFAGKERTKGREKRRLPWLLPAVFLSGMLLSFGLLLAVDAVYSGCTFREIAHSWFQQYGGNGGFTFFPPAGTKLWGSAATGNGELAAAFVIYSLAAFQWVGFGYVRIHKSDAFGLCLCALTAALGFGIGGLDYGLPLSLVWAVSAGLGLSTLLEAGGFTRKETVTQKGAPESETVSPASETASPALKAASLPLEIEELTAFVPIPNPLPLPKKHEKRQMDFGIEPQGREADYDTAVAEEDDFDLQ